MNKNESKKNEETNEIWVEMFGNEMREVSNLGRLRVKATGKIETLCTTKFDYKTKRLYFFGEKKDLRIHRLVFASFNLSIDIEKKDENGMKLDIHHINQIKDDNRLCNLQAISRVEHTILHNNFVRLLTGKHQSTEQIDKRMLKRTNHFIPIWNEYKKLHETMSIHEIADMKKVSYISIWKKINRARQHPMQEIGV